MCFTLYMLFLIKLIKPLIFQRLIEGRLLGTCAYMYILYNYIVMFICLLTLGVTIDSISLADFLQLHIELNMRHLYIHLILLYQISFQWCRSHIVFIYHPVHFHFITSIIHLPSTFSCMAYEIFSCMSYISFIYHHHCPVHTYQ